eukprot:TRINITY_DN2460_c1_g1_i1.p1 TRINITY_DN2460_c1_g1~~TRINITY_DN2460_c1_g1_i1.p1  ORF type:complete len:143 (+),score=13.88 TRINITY_DN2460_c1_g1_i1:235-663(+)
MSLNKKIQNHILKLESNAKINTITFGKEVLSISNKPIGVEVIYQNGISDDIEDDLRTIHRKFLQHTLYKELFTFNSIEYLVTSNEDHGYYARSTDPINNPGGLIVLKTSKHLLVVTYCIPVIAAEIVPLVEEIKDKLISAGF